MTEVAVPSSAYHYHNMAERYWFKRKLFGWGWTPATWEGWLSMIVFFVLIFGNWQLRYVTRLEEVTEHDMYWFVAESVVLTVLLIILCAHKGETLRWQWGKRKGD